MNPKQRQKLLLYALGVVLLFFGWSRLQDLMSGPEPPAATGSRTVGSRPGRQGGRVERPDEVVELRVADLEQKPGDYSPGRDPFRFGAPPVTQVVRREPPRREPPPGDRRPPVPSGPRLPEVKLVYLGNFGREGFRIAVFSDGKEIINALAGDVLQEKFVVVAIGYESADIGYVDFPDAPPKRLAVGG